MQIGAPASVCQKPTTKPANGNQQHIPDGSPVSYPDNPPAFGKGTGATCCCFSRAARRSALRARICSGDGLEAAGFGRATGASTVTGGRSDCFAFAPETDATAIRPATALTFLPETVSKPSALALTAANERNDRGDPRSSYSTIPGPVLETLRQCAFLADRIVYRSEAEALRLGSILGIFACPATIAPPRDATVPARGATACFTRR